MAVAFPGLGAPFCGQEGGFFQRHREIMEPFLATGAALTGSDWMTPLARGSLAELSPRDQGLFAHAFNSACHAVFGVMVGGGVAWMAGYSLGIYSALAATGAITFAAGLEMVDVAHQLVCDHFPPGQYDMGATIGVTEPEIRDRLARPEYVDVALVNVNSPASLVFAGPVAPLQAFLQELTEEAGAFKAVLLEVGAPFHHPRFMVAPAARFAAHLATMAWQTPSCPILSTIDGHPMTEAAELQAFTARNLAAPIHWQKVMASLSRLGAAVVIESGPGVSLTQIARFIEGAPLFINLKNAERRLS